MTSDLVPLRDALTSTEALKEDYTRDELRSLMTVSQYRVIVAWQRDVRQFESRLNQRQKRLSEDTRVIGFASFLSPAQAYQLTWVLAGKELSEGNVRPLAEAVVEMIESGVASRGTPSSLEKSDRFRAAAE